MRAARVVINASLLITLFRAVLHPLLPELFLILKFRMRSGRRWLSSLNKPPAQLLHHPQNQLPVGFR